MTSGRYCAGSVSSCSTKTPSEVILPSTWRSAEQLTPMPTGHDAPWRGSRITRTSWQKYLPPNCAPIPVSAASCQIFASSSTSRIAWPSSFPEVGSPSRYRVDAYLTVLRFISAEVPPTTIARWYGGQADVPRVRIFSATNASSDSGFSNAFVSWYRNVLLALPPPFVTTRKRYSSPSMALRSIWAGRLVPVLRSSYIEIGASWEYRKLVSV